MAEWSCSGLQSRVRRFDSDPSLHSPRSNPRKINEVHPNVALRVITGGAWERHGARRRSRTERSGSRLSPAAPRGRTPRSVSRRPRPAAPAPARTPPRAPHRRDPGGLRVRRPRRSRAGARPRAARRRRPYSRRSSGRETREPGLAELARDPDIARTRPPAAAAVGEDHESARAGGDVEHTAQRRGADRYRDLARRDARPRPGPPALRRQAAAAVTRRSPRAYRRPRSRSRPSTGVPVHGRLRARCHRA